MCLDPTYSLYERGCSKGCMCIGRPRQDTLDSQDLSILAWHVQSLSENGKLCMNTVLEVRCC